MVPLVPRSVCSQPVDCSLTAGPAGGVVRQLIRGGVRNHLHWLSSMDASYLHSAQGERVGQCKERIHVTRYRPMFSLIFPSILGLVIFFIKTCLCSKDLVDLRSHMMAWSKSHPSGAA